MKPAATAYCLDWHIHRSRAFHDLLVEPLAPFVDVELVAWDGRSGDPLENWKQRVGSAPLIFCQRPPPAELLAIPGAQLIWIPMWDNVVLNWASETWWASLPKTLRVIAFSEAVAHKSLGVGLPTLNLQYFKNPNRFPLADWTDGHVLMYWNRVGLFGPTFLAKLCATLDIREFMFRGDPDRKISPKAVYRLPAKLGHTIVREISGSLSQADYFCLLRRCNFYLAPRAVEGVGMTFLEALASGCAVLACNAPTMNEYITHGEDGYLFRSPVSRLPQRTMAEMVKSRVLGLPVPPMSSQPYQRIAGDQDWPALRDVQWQRLGAAASQRHGVGYARWEAQRTDYTRFVLEW